MNLNKITQQFLLKIPNLTNKKIAVGYSAGADSTALLHILSQKSHHFKFSLEAVFFSHNGSPINEGEDKNLELARDMCQSLNIKLTHVELNLVKTAKQSWEQLGRKGRLKFYSESDFDLVFLGHHQDDQNETTMMQIMRGGGRGASGMKPIDGIFCRPFLKVPKKEIYAYLKEKDVPWIEDPTNTNIEFTRNFWRNVGLPTIQKHYENQDIGQLLENFRDKNNQLNQIAYDMALVDGLKDFLEGKAINVSELPNYRIQNLLTFSFSTLGNSLENNKIDNLLKLGKSNQESEIALGNNTLRYNGTSLSLVKEQKIIRHKP